MNEFRPQRPEANSWTLPSNNAITNTTCVHSLPALARLLPKLNGGAEVVDTPKFPILKFTAGLAVNPKPPKLNPLAVEFAVSSPPNPDEWEAEKKARKY